MTLKITRKLISVNMHKGRYGPIKSLVIHAMVGYYGPSIALFQRPGSNVSAHYCVSKEGDVTQLVEEADTAYHCVQYNPFAIGLEAEDQTLCMKNGCWFTPPLRASMIELAANICERHGLSVTDVIQHSDPMLRKFGNNHIDAGPYFPMAEFRDAVQLELNSRHPIKSAFRRMATRLTINRLTGPLKIYPRAICPEN